MKNKKLLGQVTVGLIVLLFLFVWSGLPVYAAEVIFEEDFEDSCFEPGGDWCGWWADSGVWEIGEPTFGPAEAHSPTKCAATVLDGYYPPNTDSHLIFPKIFELPNVIGEERIHLRFWQWFSYSSGGIGYIQINEYDDDTGDWLGWENIVDTNFIVNTTPVWSLMAIDLTNYAGKTIKIAFYHTNYGSGYSFGWYIDDIQIIRELLTFTGDFESGWVDWYADRGVWEVGTPTAGPEECHQGIQCAGTVLDGYYPVNTDSRLISVPIRLCVDPPEIQLRFWHWFSYSSGGIGYIQINEYDDVTGEWSGWTDLDSISGVSSVWSPLYVDLNNYAGKMIKIAFYHTADGSGYSFGWYIDDVEIIGCVCTDSDGDGYTLEGGACGPTDCDDTDPKVYPDAPELYDGKDNNCNGEIDEYRVIGDVDGDGDVDIDDVLCLFRWVMGRLSCMN